MARYSKWAILLLVGFVALSARADVQVDDEIEDDGKAFLLVRRKLSEERSAMHKPVTVTIEIYNGGASPATKVKATDEAWPAEMFDTHGILTADFDQIAPGTAQSYSYSVTPKGSVAFMQRPAVVSYVAEQGGKQISTSSPWLPFRSFTAQELMISKALDFGSKATFGVLNTPNDWIRTGVIFGAFLIVYMGYNMTTAISASRKKSKRSRALKELGIKDE